VTEATTIPQNEYGQYCLPDGVDGRPAAKAVISGQVFEPDTIAFMRKHAGDGDIIHAGTFFGDFLPGLSGGMAEGAKIWAFEPNPGNFKAAEQTIKLNDLQNVELRNAALSNQDGELLFRTHRTNGKALGGLSRIATEQGPGVQSVQALMLDYVVPIDRKVSILQLDVEGHEKPAMRGAYHIIHKWKPILILEYFGKVQWLNRNFRSLGYKPIGKLHSNYVYATESIDI